MSRILRQLYQIEEWKNVFVDHIGECINKLKQVCFIWFWSVTYYGISNVMCTLTVIQLLCKYPPKIQIFSLKVVGMHLHIFSPGSEILYCFVRWRFLMLNLFYNIWCYLGLNIDKIIIKWQNKFLRQYSVVGQRLYNDHYPPPPLNMLYSITAGWLLSTYAFAYYDMTFVSTVT